ncbi:MAG: sigma-70 family RNA polymerase sigma factor [Oscillospiraceae bacterium]|nr:sigma-70 family RNA polymerase sigma factor [Oscillospiraceae bacterium]
MTKENLEDIYKRRFAMVYRVCFSYMKNTSDTEDAVADVFAKLLKKGVVFESQEHEKAWLLRVAINRCKDNLRHWWRSNSNIDDHQNIESDTLQEDYLLEMVMELPNQYKDVIYLYYYEGYGTAEIAKILKKPHSTIRYHMREARNSLKEILENEE